MVSMRLPDILKQDWTDLGRTQVELAKQMQALGKLPAPPKPTTVNMWFTGPNVPRPELVDALRLALGYAATSARARRLREACALPREARDAAAVA
jgi:hypothetical protein